MATKKTTQKAFTISATITSWVSIEIKANSFEEAVNICKELKAEDFVEAVGELNDTIDFGIDGISSFPHTSNL